MILSTLRDLLDVPKLARAVLALHAENRALRRPRVGPWVERNGYLARYDDHGIQVASAQVVEGGAYWWANRALAHSVSVEIAGGTLAQGQAAADEVLRAWAVFEGE